MIHYLLVYYVTVYRMPADSYLLRENDRRLEMSEITNEIKKRRTFAIISHPDAGKTTLTEKFLLYGGAINQAGSVKGKATAKHAVSDWMEIEKERGISVTSSVLQFNYGGYCINILDTPGHQDFSEDTYRTLMAADSAVMVIDASKGVVILAATNRPDSLDPALLRPGRFDRRIPVELPDLKGREEILKVHAKKVRLGDDIDFNAIARAASGASGAELANMVNEAALRAVRENRKYVTQADLEESIETVIAGYQKKNQVLSSKEKLIVSYHEIGHALVAALQTNSAPVTKITIIPRTSGALGYTMQVESEERNLMTQEELINKIATLTGGRCAEKLIFNSITTGASNDIEQATKLARAMITRYGMSDRFGMVALETQNNPYLGGDSSLSCSPQTAADIDQMVVDTVKHGYDTAMDLLEKNQKKLHELAKYLYEKETITGEEFMQILTRTETLEEAEGK